jgi:hypothetical protein
MHLALFSQNSINTNKIEVSDHKFETKMVSTAVKLASKFFRKMQEHVDDNSIPKDLPAFARSIFVDALGGGFVHAPTVDEPKIPATTTQPAEANPNGKGKPNGKEHDGKKKPRKQFSDKSLKMGLFHVKKGTLATKTLPVKSTLKDLPAFVWISVVMRESATSPISFARTASITPIGKMCPTTTSCPCSST